MSDNVKLAYGLYRENGIERLVHISEIKRENTGLECHCFCPSCDARLQAKLPRTDPDFTPRFAHHEVDACRYAAETAVHLKAKELLAEKKWIRLPKVYAGYENKSRILCDEREITFERVEIEYRFGKIIPDVVAYVENKKTGEVKPLLIEIKVTHGINNRKLEIIRQDELATIEVDLSDMKGVIDQELILNEVIASTGRKGWIYNKHSEVDREKALMNRDRNQRYFLDVMEKSRERRSNERKDKLERIYAVHNFFDKVESISEWENEYMCDSRWKSAVSRMQIDENKIPYYINQRIKGEFVFGCDHRIWQAVLFDQYIYVNSRKPGYHFSFTLDEVRTMLIIAFEEDIIDDFLHLKNMKECKGIADLTDVIYSYLMKLVKFGFLSVDKSKDIFKTVFHVD
ncbi:hypothetical protein SANA_28850 [Gottschalkiaceae bacterium SANA]|nr:hypothetical protein SANA_28850 [Gottschalkiaceae bacterium SANA]